MWCLQQSTQSSLRRSTPTASATSSPHAGKSRICSSAGETAASLRCTFSSVQPTREPPRVREAVLVREQRHNIQRNTFLLEELLHLFCCEQDPFPTLYK